MGGIGSGSQNKNGQVRPVVEDFLSLDILDFNKQGLLNRGTIFKNTYSINGQDIASVSICVEDNSLRLQYNHNQKNKKQDIQLARTHCSYGGSRAWLLCGQCNSKRNALYLGPEGLWACRQCLRLAYKIQRLNPHERHSYMAEKIKEKKLNITPGNYSPVSKRPFRMSRKKYVSILEEILTHQRLSNKIFITWFDGILEKADKHL